MFGKDTHTPETKSLCEPRPLRTTSIAQTLSATEALDEGTLEPYHGSYFYWINPENIITLQAIAALYAFEYGESFVYNTPSEKSHSTW